MLLLISSTLIACASPQDQVAEAALTGDAAALESLLVEGKSQINTPVRIDTKKFRCYGQRMLTPLQAAACVGREQSVTRLIRAKASLDLPTPNGQTALSLAVSNDHARVAQVLLEAGARPDHQDAYGNTALMAAVKKDNREMVDLLLKHGASVDLKNRSGNTALMVCADAAIAAKLVGLGARLDEANQSGETALHAAAQDGNVEMIQFLLERGAHPGLKDTKGMTALMKARAKGRDDAVVPLERASRKLFEQALAAADSAARQKKFDKAMLLYAAALEKAGDLGGDTEKKLRLKIIHYAKSAGRHKALPEKAREHMVRSSYMLKQGSDIPGVEREMREVVRIAPWWVEGYYNLGFVQASLNMFDEAISNLKIFIDASPRDAKAQTAQNKIYEIKLTKEEHDRVAGMQGQWVDASGNRYQLTVSGSQIAVMGSGKFFKLKNTNRMLDGSVEGQSYRGSYGCQVPGQVHPVQGTIDANAQHMTLEYMWTRYETRYHCVNMMGVRSTCCLLCDKVCDSVNIVGTSSVTLHLTRGAATSTSTNTPTSRPMMRRGRTVP